MDNVTIERPIVPDRSAYFEHLEIACMALGKDLKLVDANARARALMDEGVLTRDPSGCIGIVSDRHSRELRRFVAEALAGGQGGAVFPLGLRRWLVLTPACAERKTSTVVAMLRVTDAAESPDVSGPASAFGLSPAEQAVLQGMIDGLCPKEIACRSSVSIHTTRAHIRTIYAKMNVKSSAQMYRLVMNLAEFC